MFVCLYVCMYVCTYACICTHKCKAGSVVSALLAVFHGLCCRNVARRRRGTSKRANDSKWLQISMHRGNVGTLLRNTGPTTTKILGLILRYIKNPDEDPGFLNQVHIYIYVCIYIYIYVYIYIYIYI